MSALSLAAYLSYHVHKILTAVTALTSRVFVQLICWEIRIPWVSTLLLPRIKQILCQIRIHLSNAVITGILDRRYG